jgi:hypothetical protein
MTENRTPPTSKIATMRPLLNASVGIEYGRDGDLPSIRSEQGAPMAVTYARIEFMEVNGRWEFTQAVCEGLYVHRIDGFDDIITELSQHATVDASQHREDWLTLAILAATGELPSAVADGAGEVRAIAAELAAAPMDGLEALYWGSRHYLDIIAQTSGTAHPIHQALRTTREPLRRLLTARRAADRTGPPDA